MYLHISLIQCCRYLCGNRCIYKALIFIVADALFGINVSATCFSSNLQILLSLPVMYNCICILPFMGFKDTPFANFASTSHIFDNVKMLSSKITHPQLALSMLCRYSQSKFCIFNTLKFTIADIFPHILWVAIYFTSWADTLLTKKLIQKIARTFYGTGDFQYSFFKTLHIFLQSQEIPFREKLW